MLSQERETGLKRHLRNGLIGETHNPLAKEDKKHDKTLDLVVLELPREKQEDIFFKNN